jgi:thymidylate kinase
MLQGRMIALYGVNGIGKTTQAELLVEFLRVHTGNKVSRVKYPVYDLELEGPFLYQYLRDENFRNNHPQSTEELQLKYAENRRRYEPELKQRLASGEWIVAEDYVGTGIAWGLTWGGNLEYLEEINAGLHLPDCAILMDGKRFETAVEKHHRNEMDGERIRICQSFLRLLGERFGWEKVNARQDIEAVATDIQELVSRLLKK